MLSLNIGDRVYLTKSGKDVSVYDTVKEYRVGSDVDGNPAVVYLMLDSVGWVKITAEDSYDQTYQPDKIWTVDEVNGASPEYTLAEQAN
jgi:hypothetical protein